MEPHTAYVGKEGKKVTWAKAPPEAMKHDAMVAGILLTSSGSSKVRSQPGPEHVDPRQRAAEVLNQLAARRST